MLTVTQGKSVVLDGNFLGDNGLEDPAELYVQILDPSNNVQVFDDTPGRVGTGRYFYVYTPDLSATVGTWTITWHYTITGGEPSTVSETFQVVSPTTGISTEDTITYMRTLVDEIIPVSGTEDDTVFPDSYIAFVLERNVNNINMTASELWRTKAGKYVSMIDIDESGSSRKLSQLYKNMIAQAKVFSDLAAAELAQMQLGGSGTARSVPWLFPYGRQDFRTVGVQTSEWSR